MRTVKFLTVWLTTTVSVPEGQATYTMLLTRVHMEPTNVRKAIVRNRMFAADRGMFLKECNPDSWVSLSMASPSSSCLDLRLNGIRKMMVK
jgi:hypothetical protein